MDYSGMITFDPEVRGGKPCLRGTRLTVGDVLSYLASGMSEAEVLEDFPELTHETVMACMVYAADCFNGVGLLDVDERAAGWKMIAAAVEKTREDPRPPVAEVVGK